MPGFTGFGGNSIGSDSQFGNMGSNDPYGSGNTGGDFGHNGNGQSSSGSSSSGGGATAGGGWARSGPVNIALINAAILEAIKNGLPRGTTAATSTVAYKAMRAAFDALPVEQQPAARDQINQAWQRAHDVMPDNFTNERESGGKNSHTVTVTRTNVAKQTQAQAVSQVKNDIQNALSQHQSSDAAAKAAAQKAAAAAAEKKRLDAISAATAAGQHMSVADAQTALNKAVADVSRLNQSAQTAASNAIQKRKAANDASTQATNAENALNSLLKTISGMSVKDGKYGRWHTRTTGGKNEHTTTTFAATNITVAQVEAAKKNATSLRAQASQLGSAATTAESASVNAANAARDADNRRQAASAALTSAQQAAARAAEAERQRKAAELAAAEAKRRASEAAAAAEAARIAAEQAKLVQARQSAADSLTSGDVQVVRGISKTIAPAVIPLAWATASRGGISLGSDVVAGVWSQISAGLAELRAIATASLAGPVAVTVAWLLYSKEVGAGSDLVPGRDISSLMPADMLSVTDLDALNSAADRKTGISMPVRGRMILRADDKLETQLVRTPAVGVVPVVRAVPDQATGYWGYALPVVSGAPKQTILISPADAPGVGGPIGLTGPVPVPEYVLHTGNQDVAYEGVTTTTTPVFGEPDFRDFILIFPAESGLQPLYVMQNSPYGKATEKGKHSGRYYNPDKAGGPVQDLDWRSAVIDNAGIDKVKLHTGRFGESAANKVMIERLDKIQNGQLQVTDTDKRFYTHELRELERYRALGVPDNVDPDDEGVTWNNTHTATLEDYKINEKTDPLYTKDAEEAEYKAELKK